MRYTSKKIAEILIVSLFVVVIARLIPMWLWIAIVSSLVAGVFYFLYVYLYG